MEIPHRGTVTLLENSPNSLDCFFEPGYEQIKAFVPATTVEPTYDEDTDLLSYDGISLEEIQRLFQEANFTVVVQEDDRASEESSTSEDDDESDDETSESETEPRSVKRKKTKIYSPVSPRIGGGKIDSDDDEDAPKPRESLTDEE